MHKRNIVNPLNFSIQKKFRNENDKEKVSLSPNSKNAKNNKNVSSNQRLNNNKCDSEKLLLSKFNNSRSQTPTRKIYSGRIQLNSKTYIQKRLHINKNHINDSSSSSKINNNYNKYSNEDENDLIEDDESDDNIKKHFSTPVIHDSIENVKYNETPKQRHEDISNKNKSSENRTPQKRKYIDITDDSRFVPRKKNYYTTSQTTTPKKKSLPSVTEIKSSKIERTRTNGEQKKKLYMRFSNEIQNYNKNTSSVVFNNIQKASDELMISNTSENNKREMYQQSIESFTVYQNSINERLDNSLKKEQKNTGNINSKISNNNNNNDDN